MSAALTAFQPGDRVRVVLDYGTSSAGKPAVIKDVDCCVFDVRVAYEDGSTELFRNEDLERVPSALAEAAQLRAAAEVLKEHGHHELSGEVLVKAWDLESTSAPKPPPTLRDVLKKIAAPMDCGCVPCRGQCRSAEALQIEIDAIKDMASEALAREGAAP